LLFVVFVKLKIFLGQSGTLPITPNISLEDQKESLTGHPDFSMH